MDVCKPSLQKYLTQRFSHFETEPVMNGRAPLCKMVTLYLMCDLHAVVTQSWVAVLHSL